MGGIDVGAAYISILPSTSKIAPGIKKALGDVGGDAEAQGRRLGGGYASGLGASLKGALKGGLLAGLGGASLLGGIGLKTAADMEQLQISMETLLGSSKKAEQEVAWLTAKAAATPFELTDLAQADKTLLGFGYTSDKVRKDFLLDMGNIAAAVGIPSAELPNLARTFGQVQASGRASLEDINQLIDAGVPVWDALGKQTGLSVGEMRDALSKGQISADTFREAMSNMADTRFGDAMQKQSRTLTGQWSTLKDTLSQGLADALTPVMPTIKSALSGASAALAPALSIVGSVLEKGVALSKWAADHKPLIIGLAGAFVALQGATIAYNIAQAVTRAGGLGAYLVQVVTSTKLAAAVTKTWAVTQWLLNVAMSANPLGLVVAAIVAVVAAIVIAWKRSETFRDVVIGTWNAIKKATAVVWNAVKAYISTAWTVIKKVVQVGVAAVKAYIGGIRIVITLIRDAFEKARAAVAEKIGAVVGFVKGLPGRITSAIGNAKGILLGVGRDIIQGLLDGINTMIGKVQGALQRLTDKIPDWKGPKKKDKTLLVKAGRLIMGGLIKGIEDGIRDVRKVLKDFTKQIPKGARPAIVKAASQTYAAALDIARQRGELAKKIETATDDLNNAIGARDSFRNSVTDSARKWAADLSVEGKVTTGAIIKQMQARLAATTAFTEDLATLASLGLDASLYQQIAEAGVEGGAAIADALTKDPAAVSAVSALSAQINSAATALGSSTSSHLHDAGVAAKEALLNGLKADEKELASTAEALAKALAKALRKALGLKKVDIAELLPGQQKNEAKKSAGQDRNNRGNGSKKDDGKDMGNGRGGRPISVVIQGDPDPNATAARVARRMAMLGA